MLILDTQCYPVLEKNFAMTNTNIEYVVDDKCKEAIESFYTIAKKSLCQALEKGEPINTMRVPLITANLTFEERKTLESVLYTFGKWSVYSGDKIVTVFTPTHGLADPQGCQFVYLVNAGRLCPNCAVFTEFCDGSYPVWKCPSCKRRVGCYPHTNYAMGRVANDEERKHRTQTHEIVDRLWKEKLIDRSHVYKEISKLLGIPRQYAHIAMIEDNKLPLVNAWAETLYNKAKKENNNDTSVSTDECGRRQS